MMNRNTFALSFVTIVLVTLLLSRQVPAVAAGAQSFLVAYPVISDTENHIFAVGSFLFSDGFESGDASAWSATVP